MGEMIKTIKESGYTNLEFYKGKIKMFL